MKNCNRALSRITLGLLLLGNSLISRLAWYSQLLGFGTRNIKVIRDAFKEKNRQI